MSVSYSSVDSLYLVFGFVFLAFAYYFLFERARAKEIANSTFILTGKEVSKLMTNGVVIGALMMLMVGLDRTVARPLDNVLYFLVPLAILTLLSVVLNRKVMTPFLNRRKVAPTRE